MMLSADRLAVSDRVKFIVLTACQSSDKCFILPVSFT